jgi:2-desacetyl-2-hydroxyethyl bacteriochlorophyllide A dehydrogenase
MDEGFMNKRAVYFTAPRQIEIREESVPDLQPGEILVQTLLSAISSGTESLIYQGFFPTDLRLDENIPGLTGIFAYPLKYGYSAVGRVVRLGAGVEKTWLNTLVFAFVPHQSHFIAYIADVQPLPADLTPEDAVFLPNMETAVNLVMDGAPIIGENIAVFGQGVIGLLTTALLARFPLNSLITLDPVPTRRQRSLQAGATASLAPGLSGRWDKARRFDLVWQMLKVIQPSQLITQRMPLDQAAQAYQMLAEQPAAALQIVFTYD